MAVVVQRDNAMQAGPQQQPSTLLSVAVIRGSLGFASPRCRGRGERGHHAREQLRTSPVRRGGKYVLAAAAPARLVWLGALGTGASASKAGPLYQVLMALFTGSERAEKEQADDVALGAGATVFHAGPLADGPVSPTRRTVALAAFKRPALMPARVTRATVAAAMLDEAEKSRYPGEIVVPLP